MQVNKMENEITLKYINVFKMVYLLQKNYFDGSGVEGMMTGEIFPFTVLTV